MKYLIAVIGILIVFWIFIKVMSDWNERQAKIISDEVRAKIPISDPDRIVAGWDYLDNHFIYEDEIPIREKFDDRKQPEPYPDFHVKSLGSTNINTNTNLNRLRYINIDGKRYRIDYRSNGVVEVSLDD